MFSPGLLDLIFTKSNRGNPALQIEVQFTRNKFGRPALKMGKYMFNLYTDKRCKNIGPKKKWTCNQWYKGCRRSLMTVGSEIVSSRNEHNH
ncbi:FLYWCH zinc finger domain-containing protein [Phthorimaea operculella]|nr:FLYWCH zinc finger domain-containing protein [Phthorimaea operculella]